MRDRGKTIVDSVESWGAFETRCRRHPSQITTGICPLCLRERLNKLFCPDCGEQKHRASSSSCSCSEASSSTSSSIDCIAKKNKSNGGGGSVEVGSVGRISFLIESDRPDLESAKADAAVVWLRRSKSAACRTSSAGFDPKTQSTTPPPKTPPKKRSTIWSFVFFKKRKSNHCESSKESNLEAPARGSSVSGVEISNRVAVERLQKSRSVGVGRKSFSGYGYLWDNKSGNNNVYCTPSRLKEQQLQLPEEEVKGSNSTEDVNPRGGGRNKGWSWAFASPLRVFKHSHNRKQQQLSKDDNPLPLAEMCRG